MVTKSLSLSNPFKIGPYFFLCRSSRTQDKHPKRFFKLPQIIANQLVPFAIVIFPLLRVASVFNVDKPLHAFGDDPIGQWVGKICQGVLPNLEHGNDIRNNAAREAINTA